ncbi:MAG: MFS transporter [Oscillospiraceae bacterium]
MKNKNKLHYGWLMVFVGFMVFAIDFCVIFNCTGLYVQPVTEDLGFLRKDYALNNTVTCVAMMVLSLFSGRIYKRFSLKSVMMFGAIVCPIAYSAYSLAHTKAEFYIISAALGIGAGCIGMIPASMLITNWFNDKRGFAIGVAFMGSGAGGIVLSPVLASIIENYGWRNTFLFTGIFMFAAIVPLVALFVKSTPAEKGLEPYGGAENIPKVEQEQGVTAQQALKGASFWLYFTFPFFISTISCSIIQQTIPFAAEVGYSAKQAANFGALNLASLAVGKILLGQVYDKKGVKFATYSALAVLFVAMCGYSAGLNPVFLYGGIIISGYGSALSSVSYPIITQSLFGKKDYATIYGYLSVASSLGTAVGPVIVSSIYDALGSYQRAWVALSVACVVVTLLYALLNKVNKKERAQRL